MIKLKELLSRNELKALKYEQKDNAVLIDTNKGKYIIKKEFNNTKILEYLKNRNCMCYLEPIDSRSDYQLYPYIKDSHVPDEQKMNDLIKFISYIHRKTSYEKKVDQTEYKKMYEDLKNNVLYLREYYNDLITIIDTKEYYSPDEYLFARNISVINNSLNNCDVNIDNWYHHIEDLTKKRVTVIHNNLCLDNFIDNSNKYLINWEKSKIDIPVFDLYKLYKSHPNYDFNSLINLYEKECQLSLSERELLLLLVGMPNKIVIGNDVYNNCLLIKNEIQRLIKNTSNVKTE